MDQGSNPVQVHPLRDQILQELPGTRSGRGLCIKTACESSSLGNIGQAGPSAVWVMVSVSCNRSVRLLVAVGIESSLFLVVVSARRTLPVPAPLHGAWRLSCACLGPADPYPRRPSLTDSSGHPTLPSPSELLWNLGGICFYHYVPII